MPDAKPTLYEKGDLVVYHGHVLKCEGSYPTSAIYPPVYDCLTRYAPGDFCEYEGEVYERSGIDLWYIGPFNPKHWSKPPICTLKK